MKKALTAILWTAAISLANSHASPVRADTVRASLELQETLARSAVPTYNYNIGWGWRCHQTYADCLEDANWNLFSGYYCGSAFRECQQLSARYPKFTCHDFAFEQCRYLRREGYQASILQINGRGQENDGAHTLNIVADKHFAEPGRARYCVLEPQWQSSVFHCWEQQAGAPRMPQTAVQAIVDYYEVVAGDFDGRTFACDVDFYHRRSELPWWQSGGITDPKDIPAFRPSDIDR